MLSKRRIFSLAALTVLCAFCIAAIWELWGDRYFSQLFGFPYSASIEESFRWEFISQSALFAALGMIPSIVLGLRSVRVLKRAFDESRIARIKSERANKAKSAFMAGMSHEFRTPLNAIIGFSELIHTHAPGTFDEAKCREYAQIVHDSGKHLLALVNDILDLAKFDNGCIKLTMEPLEPGEILRETVATLAQTAAKHGIALAVAPDREAGIRLKADRTRLRQVIYNLVSNAIKFTPPGGRVTLQSRRYRDRVFIAVCDTGIGIAQSDLERVFLPFEQVDSSMSRKFDGTGLGLPLARTLTEAMDGTLTLKSRIHAGTTAILSFPQCNAAGTGAQARANDHVASASASRACAAAMHST